MSTITGGLRMRLMLDSFALALETTLTAHGWLDTNRQHLPVTLVTNMTPNNEPVAPNTVAIVATAVRSEEFEVGSDLVRDASYVTIQFNAEDDAVGVHLTNDLRDALRGRIPGGTPGGQLAILDLRMATPTTFAFAQIREVSVLRSVATVTSNWERHLFTVACYVDDFHYGA